MQYSIELSIDSRQHHPYSPASLPSYSRCWRPRIRLNPHQPPPLPHLLIFTYHSRLLIRSFKPYQYRHAYSILDETARLSQMENYQHKRAGLPCHLYATPPANYVSLRPKRCGPKSRKPKLATSRGTKPRYVARTSMKILHRSERRKNRQDLQALIRDINHVYSSGS